MNTITDMIRTIINRLTSASSHEHWHMDGSVIIPTDNDSFAILWNEAI